MPQDVPERALQVVERELVAQRGHHLVGQRAVDPQLGQLAVEEGLLVEGVGHQVRGRDEPGRLVHADPVLGVDHAGAERDRRDVPLAGGPQAEDEPARPVGQARLVGVPDHRRVEQGRRFQGVFLGEVGADQQAPALADRLVGQQVLADLLEAVQEELAGPLVPLAELPHHALQQALDLRLGEGRDAGDDLLDPVLARRLERPDDDAGVGRLEDDPGAIDVHVGDLRPRCEEWRPVPGTAGPYRAWRNAARELSSRFISARERRKARVDSAPWFRLIRSSWRPSQQPAGARVVQLLAEVVAAEEPLEGGAGLVQPARGPGWPGTPPGRRRPSRWPRSAAGRTGPARAPCGRSRGSRSPGSGPAGPSGPRPASPGPRRPTSRARASPPSRPPAIRACGSRALS